MIRVQRSCNLRCLSLRALLGPIAALLLAAPFALPAQAETADLTVDWNDQELKSFAETRAANVAAGVEAEDENNKLATLHIPVLAFERPPEAVSRNLRAGPEAEPEVTQNFDASNPVWYQIVQDYGDVTVSVAADLRVQHKFDENFPVYDAQAPGAAPAGGEPQVSVMDENAEEGMEGSIAEYTFTRFGVPYTVTVECTAVAQEQCKDKAQLAKDSALLKLVGGEPPK